MPGLSGVFFRQIHDELHAHGPVANVVTFGQAKLFIKLAANGTDGTICDDGERGVDVHAGREAVGGISFFVHALIEQADADDFGSLSRSASVPGRSNI